MSEYTQIFVRKGEDLVEIGCYGRSSSIAEFAKDYAPWEKVRELTESDANGIISEIKSRIAQFKTTIANRNEIISQIKDWNNSIDEKKEAITSYVEMNSEDEEIIEEMQFALHVFQFLSSAIYSFNLDWKYGEGEKPVKRPGFIYLGREVGNEITDDMVIDAETED